MLEPSRLATKSQKGFCWLRKRTDDMFAVVIEYGNIWKIYGTIERDGSGR